MDNTENIQISVGGINYVRPPILSFLKKQETPEYTEYEIKTDKQSKEKRGDDPFNNYLNSFIFCNDTLQIKVPTKKAMITSSGKKKFAYAVGMFPNPSNGKASYLDGCILAGLGLKRQTTEADIICFITHDISEEDKEKLEVVFDKVIYVPYISPYDMGGTGKLKTIIINKDIFKNCPGYTKKHPYVHVFFKLHIFNPVLFPYEKVCFVDSDLVPLNYYDSLFMLDCPAGFVEYRKKIPYLESYNWDRCDFLKHGHKIPAEITDIDKKTGADVNAGLLVIKPDIDEYNAMIDELKSPMEEWMGPDKIHKGFWSFNFDNPNGQEFVPNSYCYPEQNYLTKRYSGKWTCIEFAFQSWALDPCNSFGIHMAAFNPKPWFIQPIGGKLQIKEKVIDPYLNKKKKKMIDVPVVYMPDSFRNYDNISFSYEIFNEVIIWGLITYPKLTDFFIHGTKISGKKTSFDQNKFDPINKTVTEKLLKKITKKDPIYKKLSLSQKYISDLLNKDPDVISQVKDNYLQICRAKTVDRDGKELFNYQIIDYPEYKTRYENKKKIKGGKKTVRKHKKSYISRKNKIRKRTPIKKKKSTKPKVYYFSMDGCHYCKEFEPLWAKLQDKYSMKYHFIHINRSSQSKLLDTYSHLIDGFPTIILVKHNKPVLFKQERTLQNFNKFLS